MMVSMRPGSSRDRLLIKRTKRAKNCRSDWADVAGTDRYSLATLAVNGYNCFLFYSYSWAVHSLPRCSAEKQ